MDVLRWSLLSSALVAGRLAISSSTTITSARSVRAWTPQLLEIATSPICSSRSYFEIMSSSTTSQANGGEEESEHSKVAQLQEERAKRCPPQDFCFQLGEKSVLCLGRGDLTKWSVDSTHDAIVNAANERMLGGGGVDGAIHRAAGAGLLKECSAAPEVRPGVRCPTGSAVITGGHRLKARHIIHTVGPVYGAADHELLLASAYRSCITVAHENKLKYLAFPAISCGIYGYPYPEAAEVAIKSIRNTIHDLPPLIEEVHFVLFEQPAWDAWLEKARQILQPLPPPPPETPTSS